MSHKTQLSESLDVTRSTITNPQVFLNADDFRQLGSADSTGQAIFSDPLQVKQHLIASIGHNSLTIESARASLLVANQDDSAAPYQLAIMATVLNIDWSERYGLRQGNRHEFIAQLQQGRPQPSPIRPLLSYAILRGVLRANSPDSDSPFDARIWLNDIGFVSRFIMIFYPSVALSASDYTQIAETICADYRPNALASGISLIDSLISPHLHVETCQSLVALAESLRHPSQFLGQTPSTLLSDFERTLASLKLAPEALRRLQDVIQSIRACFEARKVERAQTVANHINSTPFLNALATEWQQGERHIAHHLHEAYSHTGQRHSTHGRRAMGFAVTISLVVLFVLLGAVQWLLSTTIGVWQHASIGTLQMLTAFGVWIISAHIQKIRQQYGSLKTAKTIPGLHQLGFTSLLQRPFHPYAHQRLQQLRQLYRDYAIPYNQIRMDQLERWLEQGDMHVNDQAPPSD